ncbi:BlyB family putative holin accessory protein [Borreliella bavariensis]|uniref:BlyB family putative holin accessory protein n=1 Tax=Borreliella bavariensis TaxID=664662 RepID=UPI001C00A9E6|nr:BlyB family putative holin accessory protein [Borreliella bavariensis]
MKLSKDNLETGLTSISNLIDIFSKFEDEFDKIAHKGFFLVYELYDLVNSDEKNLKISNNLKFNKKGKPIYQEGANNAK